MRRPRDPDHRAAGPRSGVRPDDRRIGHVLFYGTLCRREPKHARLGLPDALTYLGERTLTGTLYDLGGYPGLILGSGSTIAELYRIVDANVLRRLDGFEGYDPRDPGRSPFRRAKVPVSRFARSSATLDAWLYVFNGPVAGRPRIEASSWREHRARGARAP